MEHVDDVGLQISMSQSNEMCQLNITYFNIQDQCFQFIFHIFYNIMFYNPFESKASRVSLPLKQSDFHSSQLNSRSIVQLAINKPLYLMGQSTASNISNIQPQQNKHACFQLREAIVNSPHEVIARKQNPFITTKPYQYKPIAYPNEQKGLFLWQKNKYLSTYGVKAQKQVSGEYIQANIERQHLLPMRKAERVQQILSEVVISYPSIKEELQQNDKPVFYRKDTFNAPQNPRSEASLINNLDNIPETKPTQQTQVINMQSSKVFQYEFGTNLKIQNNQDEQYNFDTGRLLRLTEANRELDETSKFNSLRPPLTINIDNTVYELISLC